MRLRTCVVVVGNFDCGEPVFDERGGYPMCRKHFDLFAPTITDHSAVTQVEPEADPNGSRGAGS